MSARYQRLTDEQVSMLLDERVGISYGYTRMLDASEVIALAREVQELRANLDNWEAIRQTVNCPTCGGTCAIEGTERREVIYDAETGEPCGETRCDPRIPCPDNCGDGKIDMARLLAVGAAVFADDEHDRWRVGSEVKRYLRRVRP